MLKAAHRAPKHLKNAIGVYETLNNQENPSNSRSKGTNPYDAAVTVLTSAGNDVYVFILIVDVCDEWF